MNKVMMRVGAAATAAMAVGLLAVPSALADDCTISDNGAFSSNRCRIKTVNKTTTVQKNNAAVTNTVVVTSNTGGNKANFNTGSGSVSVTTGASSTTVSITNSVNSNTISVP